MKFGVMVFAMLLCAGCSRDARTPVVVYSPHGKELLSVFEKAFEAAHPEIDVQWLDMGSQDVYDRIHTERDNPQADVWWGAPMTIFDRAEEEHLLEKYIPSWDVAVDTMFKSRNGFWYGTFLTPEVILYNSTLVPAEDAPKDWDDLLDAKWKGKIVLRSPLASGTMRIIFSALIARAGSTDAGMEWLRKLDANTKSYAADPTQMYLAIARGEGSLSVWNLPDAVVQKKTNGYPFATVVPRSGTPMITDCIAIVKGAPHEAAAKLFYEFVTTKESLIRQADQFTRIPVRSDIRRDELPDWIRELTLKPMAVDWHAAGKHEAEWMKRWDDEVRGRGSETETVPR